MDELSQRLKLHGFNNLTKSLSFNIYDICYAHTPEQRREYIEYIDEEYNAERLTRILTDVTEMLDATVLNIARQDYDPQGASVTMLIAEEQMIQDELVAARAAAGVAMVAHLDKSHITVHTYPESHPDNGISTFRADIDVSTCGQISPLKALNHLIHSFDSDVVTIDYRVRGFTRDVNGSKHFIDHGINSIQDFVDEETRRRYQTVDVNIYEENIFHTKMRLKELALDEYLFGTEADSLSAEQAQAITSQLQDEVADIFYGRRVKRR